ncbi:stage II sporulation protein M [Galbitalea sp. SE-J8]|uniref:stage II sporulation protein M n=1 Tax=Galbitalea sp. SE-J8 TaxID=3054952 RepID=UPI00259CEEAA|nr:stage II sporulation protein M [Galbitalea sp. SE-J8]MDM4762711.1 stage II sporulation protein M [Galbitalea sp. SE-J8]
MDLDALRAARREEWDRLARLAARRRPDGAEADELIERYQSGASDLSLIRSTAGDSVAGDRLAISLARARLRFTGTSTNVLARIPSFFVLQLPAALYRIRILTLVVAAATAVVAVITGWWISAEPRAIAQLGSEADLQEYAEKDFVSYYSDHSGGIFSGTVWTNNAFLAAQCVAFGITGIYPVYLLLGNAASLGEAGAVLAHFGHLDTFFLYIAPHGQLELYSIFLAAAAGLRVFWAWVAPGPRARVTALSTEGRAMFAVVIGLIVFLFMSGLVEGWVTRQDWPWSVKIGVGTLALAVVLVYQWVIGGRAARAGHTGDLEEFEAGARRLVAG